MPASVLERDILPARVQGYQPRMLDELLASGVVWVGAGSLGRDDGRVVAARTGRACPGGPGGRGARGCSRSLGPRPADTPPIAAGEPPHSLPEPARPTRRPHPASGRGGGCARRSWASSRTGRQLLARCLAAVLRAAADGGVRPPNQRSCSTPCGTWCGEAPSPTTFLPLRALRWPRGGRDRAADRPRLGATGRVGPPEVPVRWSLVSEAVATAVALAGGSPSETERRHAIALRLLDRHGVVTRDAVAAEDITGGFSAVYPILREMEDRGRVRRGYFVEGLGGAQFALPAAVDRRFARRPAPGDDGADAETWWCWQPRTRPTRMVPHCRGHSRRRAA